MKTIVAIGGGNMRMHSTRSIDQEIVNFVGKKNPKWLFIPTASSDDQGYWDVMRGNYSALGCKVEVLFLLKEKPSYQEIENKILGSDIIYVGGGNTLMMMRLWRRLGVDKLLKKAYEKGIVLCGVSAGSICWFEYGHSDSMSYYNSDNWKYIKVRGLGFIQGIHCPHFDSATLGVKRRKNFHDMMSKQREKDMGIAIDDNCAIAFINDKYRVISSKNEANAYRIYKKKESIIVEVIEKKKSLTLRSTLYTL